MKDLEGIVIPLITPYTENDEVDVKSLKKLVDYCINTGLTALYPCGTTGEMMYLSTEERKLIAEITVHHTAGRIPVYVHVGAWSQASTIELAQHAVSIGADGIGVVTPAFFKLSDKGLIDFYKAVSASVPEDFPIYLYGIPQNAVNDISENVVNTLADECPNIVGIKYSFPNFIKMQNFMKARNETFRVLAGPDNLFAPFYFAGGLGVVSGNAMCIPEHYVAQYDAIKAGDITLATKIQRRTNVLNDIMCSINNIAAYKVLMKNEGVIATTKMRRPLENLTPDQEKDLLDTFAKLEYKKVII